MRQIILFVFFFLMSMLLMGQTDPAANTDGNKGKVYVSWGWNAGWYSNADLHFKGDQYDFVLKDVVATDRQTPFALDPYFHPGKITIPQTNFRLGYFFKNNWNISLGFDHMKYVLQRNQIVKINGEINAGNDDFDGIYQDEQIELTKDFIQFEHTDGLNYINVELRRVLPLVSYKKINLQAVGGAGIGFLMPRTRTFFLGKLNRDAYKVSGFGIAPLLGINLEIGKWFFLQSEYKIGYINMPSVRISNVGNAKASQTFFFRQFNYVFGFSKQF